uniref:YL1_C domain-containing protein n=1 Tax=Macrostomum lignano TaxID=282301 RepID=A0A1I8H6F0_9PLAT
MSFYRNSYVPAFTSNDAYGNFYDSGKVSLITVPNRLKNYDLDVRKAGTPTTAAEYGDFLRRDGQYRAPAGFVRLQDQQAELQQQQLARYPPVTPPPQSLPPPPPPPPHHLPPLQHPTFAAGAADDSPAASPEPHDRPADSVRGPPPPATLDRY